MELAQLSLSELEQAAMAWNAEREKQQKIAEAKAQEEKLRQEDAAFQAVAELLPAGLRPLIEFRYFYNGRGGYTHVQKAGLVVNNTTWRVWVDLEKHYLGSPWTLAKDSGYLPFTPLQPTLIRNEETDEWEVNWIKGGCGATDDLLEAIAGAMEMGTAYSHLVEEAHRRNSTPVVKEPVYENASDDQPVAMGLVGELVTMIRDVVKEELAAVRAE
jgi:hypothetical protein